MHKHFSWLTAIIVATVAMFALVFGFDSHNNNASAASSNGRR